jgi:hypothetical protein
VRVLVTAAAVTLNVTLFIVPFRVLTARPVTVKEIRAGAVAAVVSWQALQWIGVLLLGHKLKGATATYGLFAIAYTSYAMTERYKSFENIDVSFGELPHQGPFQPPGGRAGRARRSRRRA